MHTKGTDVCSSLAADPENTQLPFIVELVKFALVDGSDTELSLDSRNERRTLEEGSGKSFEGASELGLATRELVVQADNADILLSSTLLRLHETGRAVDADNKAASNLWVESSAVASLLNSRNLLIESHRCLGIGSTQVPQDALDPSYDLMTGGVGGLVEVDHTGADVLL
jgi:hypothetical protein